MEKLKTYHLDESTHHGAAIIFGRFNPPHFGHSNAWTVASKFPIWYVGTNQSTQGPKDPLPFDVKVEAMKTIMPGIEGHLVAEQSWWTLATMVYKKHGGDMVLHVVTDPTDKEIFVPGLLKANGVEGAHGYYKFQDVLWAPATRDSTATALRAAVEHDNPQAFSKAAGVDANTMIAGHSFFELVKHYMSPYLHASAEKERLKAEKEKQKAEKLAMKQTKIKGPAQELAEAEGTPSGVPHVTKELLKHIVKQVGTEGAHAIVKSLEWGDGAAKELLHLIVNDLEKDIKMSESTEKRCMQCGMKNCKCPGDSCKCKPIAGWIPGKGFKKAIDEADMGKHNNGTTGFKALAKKAGQLEEEEADYYRDYKNGLISYQEYQELVKQFQGRSGQHDSHDEKPVLVARYFYHGIPADKERAAELHYKMKKTKSGKWNIPVYTTSGFNTTQRIASADSWMQSLGLKPGTKVSYLKEGWSQKESGGGQPAAIAIAKKASGKYSKKTGKRLHEMPAHLRNDPDGHTIIPHGGMGSGKEETWRNLSVRKLEECADMIRAGNYTNAEHVLYKGGFLEGAVRALARYEEFKHKQGRRPLARGREIDLG